MVLASSTTGDGVPEVWDRLTAMHAHLQETAQLDALRARQAKAWLWSEIRSGLLDRFRADAGVADALGKLEAEVEHGALSPTAAAQQLLDRFSG